MGGIVVDVFGASKKHAVMADTWGHLYPKPGSKHKGYIVVVTDDDRSQMVVKTHFPTLECSPQRHELEGTILKHYEWPRRLAMYRIDCELWFYKSSNDMYRGGGIGKIIKKRLKEIELKGV